MDLKPDEFYNMLPKDFAAMTEGVSRKIYRQSSELRLAAFVIISPHVKDLPYVRFCREFWKLPGDKIESLTYDPNVSPEVWKEIKKQQFEDTIKEHNKKLSAARRNK